MEEHKIDYQRILDNTAVYDRVKSDLLEMSEHATNPRQRKLAGQCLFNLEAVLQVAQAMVDIEKNGYR